MEEKETSPEKLEFGQWFSGRSHPLWHYRNLPEGMRLAENADLFPGRQLLYQVQIGPDAGEFYTCYFVGNFVKPVKEYLRRGIPVYVKD